MTAWESTFPVGARVVALPTWRRPRVYLDSSVPAERRKALAVLYPASRPLAQAVRAASLSAFRWHLGRTRAGAGPDAFVAHALAAYGHVGAMLPGAPGPTRKATLALIDEHGHITAFAKLADQPAARGRLRHEHAMLEALGFRDLSIAPKALGLYEDETRTLLVIAAVPGATPAWSFPPPAALAKAVALLHRGPHRPVRDHAWLVDLAAVAGEAGRRWIAALAGHDWPVSIRHGDLTAGHVVVGPADVILLDWEYGALEGFPWVDLIHGCLQALALVERVDAIAARALLRDWLGAKPWPALERAHAEVLIAVAAFAAHRDAAADGHPDTTPLQRWRRALWS